VLAFVPTRTIGPSVPGWPLQEIPALAENCFVPYPPGTILSESRDGENRARPERQRVDSWLNGSPFGTSGDV
jgi:hypothetical protein